MGRDKQNSRRQIAARCGGARAYVPTGARLRELGRVRKNRRLLEFRRASAVHSMALSPIPFPATGVAVYPGVGQPTRQVAWMDRGGRPLAVSGTPGNRGQSADFADGNRAVVDECRFGWAQTEVLNAASRKSSSRRARSRGSLRCDAGRPAVPGNYPLEWTSVLPATVVTNWTEKLKERCGGAGRIRVVPAHGRNRTIA
jgi:hypothetical protein